MDYIVHPAQLITASLVGFALLLVMIIKFKIHALLAIIISAIVIGFGSGMPYELVTKSVLDGMSDTLASIALIVGLGAMFGGILDASGAAYVIAHKFVGFFGEKRAPIAFGIAGMIIGIPVFYDPAFIILIPIAFSVAKQTKRSVLCYVLPMVTGLGIGGYIPPTPAPLLITGNLPCSLFAVTNLALLTAIPFFIVKYALSMYIANKVYVKVPDGALLETQDKDRKYPAFSVIMLNIALPIVLILLGSSFGMLKNQGGVTNSFYGFIEFIGQPYLALIISNIVAIFTLCKPQGITFEQTESILSNALKPVALIVLVTSAGGVLKFTLRYSGMGDVIGDAFANLDLPIVLSAFVIATIMRIAVGSMTVALTMTLGIIASFPQISEYSEMYIACIGLAAMIGAGSFSHVNDSGFWLTKQYLGIDLKTAFKTWTLQTGLGSFLQIMVLYPLSFIWV